ncbi:MAG TPA: hypothetical protein VNK41_02455 [Vicinamibacterales bacterium]|nr:hypothetical protein [Vicinamibacterales bacterium]
MVPLTSLVVPIVLSAVIVFLASAVIHMALGYHRNDTRAVPDEDALQTALRNLSLAPGDYVVPFAGGPSGMKDPAFQERMRKGPLALLTVRPGGDFGLGRSLALWFVFTLVVGLFSAYIAGRTLEPGAPYLQVFRIVGTSAFMGYSLALLHDSIWYWRNWRWTLLNVLDGLVYALLTAGVFGWLWPR